MALAFWTIPNDHFFLGLGTRYVVPFVLTLPLAAGWNGFYSVKHRLSSADDDVISAISQKFLFATIFGYVTLIFCLQPLGDALRHFLK